MIVVTKALKSTSNDIICIKEDLTNILHHVFDGHGHYYWFHLPIV